MHLTTDGIVLRARPTDESDCILTLLTKEKGVITAYARGAHKPRSTLRASAALLSHSCFVLFFHRERCSVDKADLEHLFMEIRGDLERLSLASYFCQLTAEIAPQEQPAEEYLRLLLNTLHMLDSGKRSCDFLKPVYELRLLTMAGFMPNLVACQECGCFESEQMWFLPGAAALLCADCVAQAAIEPRQDGQLLPVSKGALAAMRHILYADGAKLFAFRLEGPALEQLCAAAQQYVLWQTERKLDTLNFYESIRNPTPPTECKTNDI